MIGSTRHYKVNSHLISNCIYYTVRTYRCRGRSSSTTAKTHNMTKYKLLEAFLTIVLSVKLISSAQTGEWRVNLTRQNNGDVLVFEERVDCGMFDAQCFGIGKGKQDNNTTCKRCKCLPSHTTYVTTRNKCESARGIPSLNCDTTKQDQVAGVEKGTITKSVKAFFCKVVETNPEIYNDDGRNDGRWIKIKDIEIRLKRPMRRRGRNWKLTFNKATVPKMQAKYAGRIFRSTISCKMRASDFVDRCIIFKTAGSLVVNATITILPHPTSLSPFVSGYPTSVGEFIFSTTAQSLGSNGTSEDQESKNGFPVFWIIVIVAFACGVIVTVVAVCLFMRFKTRGTKQSDGKYRSHDIALHDYQDVPGQGSKAPAEDHIYETVSETKRIDSPIDISPEVYQELDHNNRANDASHYQSLLKPELEYVDVIPDK